MRNDSLQALRHENARLHQALAEASIQNVRLQASLDAAVAELVALRTEARATQRELTATITALSEQIALSNERVAELLAIAQRTKRPEKKAEAKPPPPPPNLDAAARTAFEERPKPPHLPERPKKERSGAKPTGRKPLPAHLTAEEHTLLPEVCPCGCRDFEIVDEVLEEKLTVVREHQRRRVVHRKTGRCKRCRTRTTADSLPAPFARSKVTCSWLAWLLVQKYVQLTPLDRVRDLLHLQGIPLSMSFLVTQVQRATALLAAIDGVHWAQLLAGDWMTHDGTPLAVIVAGVPGTHKGHLEVFQRDGLVVLQYEADKAGDTLASKLQRFSGTLVADAEHRHNATFATGRIVEAGCNAHGERKLEAAEVSQPVLAREGRTFIQAIFAEEAKAREQGLEGDELRTWRQERIGPLYEAFARWRDAVLPTLLPDEALAGVLRYYTNHWAALTRWVGDPKLPPDNSASERVFQRVAKLRLACLFAGSTEGAHAMAVLMGLSATCRNLGVDPQAYFTWALERRGTHAEVFGLDAHQLTPAAFKLTLSA